MYMYSTVLGVISTVQYSEYTVLLCQRQYSKTVELVVRPPVPSILFHGTTKHQFQNFHFQTMVVNADALEWVSTYLRLEQYMINRTRVEGLRALKGESSKKK